METKINNSFAKDLESKLKNSDTYVKDMLGFYEEGWDARGVDDKEKFESRVRANVVNTLTYLDEVIALLESIEINIKSAHIKLENPNSQSVLIAVGIEDYLSDSLLAVYQYTHKIEKKSRSENYRVSFLFTYDEGNLDKDSLTADGYVTTHIAD